MDFWVPILSETDDTIVLNFTQGVLVIGIHPEGEIIQGEHTKLHTVSLRISGAKKLRKCIRYGEKFWAKDLGASFWKENSTITIRMRVSGSLEEYIQVRCKEEDASVFEGVLEYIAGNVPEVIQPLFNQSADEILFRHLFLGIGDKPRLKGAEYWNLLGQIIGTQGNFELASTWFLKALQINPDYHSATLNLAGSLVVCKVSPISGGGTISKN
jgi:hypothetical protein